MIPGWESENKLAVSLGWECKKDSGRGPHWCRFQKGKETVWDAGRFWARSSRDVDERSRNHKAYDTLKNAFNEVAGIAYGPDSNPRKFSHGISFRPPSGKLYYMKKSKKEL